MQRNARRLPPTTARVGAFRRTFEPVMFHVTDRYDGPAGRLRCSHVREAARFAGRTTGLAIKYVRRGEEVYQLPGAEVRLSGGQFLLLPADCDFAAQHPRRRRQTDGICIDLPLCLEDAAPDLLFRTPFTRRVIAFTALPDEPFGTDPEEVLAQCTSAVHELAGRVTEWDDRLCSEGRQTATRRALLPCLLVARHYLHEHYAAKITLAQLAAVAGLSPYHLARLFKRCFGLTPLDWQHRLRLQRATELMQDPQRDLTQVALAVGYADLPAFSRRFRAEYGVPPSRWR